MVEGIRWYATDPLGPMPAALDKLDEPERTWAIANVKAMVDEHGASGAKDIAARVAEHLSDGPDRATWSPRED